MGRSSAHATHHDAQKSRTTGLPRRSDTLTRPPLSVSIASRGAALPTTVGRVIAACWRPQARDSMSTEPRMIAPAARAARREPDLPFTALSLSSPLLWGGPDALLLRPRVVVAGRFLRGGARGRWPARWARTGARA